MKHGRFGFKLFNMEGQVVFFRDHLEGTLPGEHSEYARKKEKEKDLLKKEEGSDKKEGLGVVLDAIKKLTIQLPTPITGGKSYTIKNNGEADLMIQGHSYMTIDEPSLIDDKLLRIYDTMQVSWDINGKDLYGSSEILDKGKFIEDTKKDVSDAILYSCSKELWESTMGMTTKQYVDGQFDLEGLDFGEYYPSQEDLDLPNIPPVIWDEKTEYSGKIRRAGSTVTISVGKSSGKCEHKKTKRVLYTMRDYCLVCEDCKEDLGDVK